MDFVDFVLHLKGLMEGSDLSTKKCIPCSSKDIHAMSRESAMELLPQV